MSDTIIICTTEEMLAMHERGEISDQGGVITLSILFEFLCDYYGVDPHWQPNDVY
jgi:hypothetical protein